MLATAAAVESTTGKKAAMKIRKMAGASPMPSQRIANGIHASGDRLRKKFTSRQERLARPGRVTQQQPGRDAQAHGQEESQADAEQRRDGVVDEPEVRQLRAPGLARPPTAWETAIRETGRSDAIAAHTATSAAGPASASHGPPNRSN